MKPLLFLLLTLYSQVSLGQKQYLNKNHQPGGDKAVYYRITEQKGNLTLVKEFYVENDQLALKGFCSALDPFMVWQGRHMTYHKNGNVESMGEYLNGGQIGVWKYYYDNGLQSGEDLFSDDQHYFTQRWDEAAKPLLINGTGTFFQNIDDTRIYCDIVDHKLRSSFNIEKESGDSIYVVVEKTAEYKTGIEGLYEFIAKSIKYPAVAKRKGIEGKVFVEFVVDKNGTVYNLRVLRPIGGGCDEEAMKSLQSAGDWSPGQVNGKPVRQKMVLPINFKLG